jgi:hypothetical protein
MTQLASNTTATVASPDIGPSPNQRRSEITVSRHGLGASLEYRHAHNRKGDPGTAPNGPLGFAGPLGLTPIAVATSDGAKASQEASPESAS